MQRSKKRKLLSGKIRTKAVVTRRVQHPLIAKEQRSIARRRVEMLKRLDLAVIRSRIKKLSEVKPDVEPISKSKPETTT